jgi:hypothetical protein
MGKMTRRITCGLGAVVALGILFAVLEVGLFAPRKSLKTGTRITNANSLAVLGKEIALWRGDGSSMVPARLDELSQHSRRNLGERTNSFFYLGTNWKHYGIVAVEKLPQSFRGSGHWTDQQLAVLKVDMSVTFVPTNALPVSLLKRVTDDE